MNCLAVRDRLPEHALGVLGSRERSPVERHLVTCAACRKEAEDLAQAGALLGRTAPLVEPPPGLGDAIVDSVHRHAAKGPATRRRMRITAAAASLAALIAVGGLGWGAVMADRAGDAEQRAARADRARETAVAVEQVFRDRFVFGPRDSLGSATLAAQDGSPGGGWAFVLTRPGQPDLTLMRAFDLPPAAPLPLRVWLTDRAELRVLVGRVHELDDEQGFEQAEQTGIDLGSVAMVVVKDAEGRTVLAGDVTPTDP